jgi:hypothetical protein
VAPVPVTYIEDVDACDDPDSKKKTKRKTAKRKTVKKAKRKNA